MSKKLPKELKVPEIYGDLELPTNKIANRAVAFERITDNNNVFLQCYVYPDASCLPLVTSEHEPPLKSLDSLLSSKRLTEAHHERVFSQPIPKGYRWEDAALYVWAWYVRNAKPVIAGIDQGGNKIRKSTIGARLYCMGDGDVAQLKDMPPQARACWDIFHGSLNREGDTAGGVTEAELRARVEQNAGLLNTKQDPWRIFQYYRPRFIQAKLMRAD